MQLHTDCAVLHDRQARGRVQALRRNMERIEARRARQFMSEEDVATDFEGRERRQNLERQVCAPQSPCFGSKRSCRVVHVVVYVQSMLCMLHIEW